MPINGFSVGRDVSLNVVTARGPLSLNLITSFKSKQEIQEVKIKGLDGITRHVRFPDGWTGTFMIERQDSTIDAYFAQLEANYYAGQSEVAASITETISEVSGALSQFRYIGVLFKLDDAGEWAGDATVKMSLSFVAARRIQIA